MAETQWNGWSTIWPSVHLTCVVAGLLRSAHPHQLTGITVQDILTDLSVADLSAADVISAITADPAAFALTDPHLLPARQPLKITPHGRRLAAEFRANQESLAVFRAAQHALLLWCAAHPASEFLHPADMLTEPASWFYGTKFSPGCLQRAADALTTAGYLFTAHTASHPVVQLAPAGLRWIEKPTASENMTKPLPFILTCGPAAHR